MLGGVVGPLDGMWKIQKYCNPKGDLVKNVSVFLAKKIVEGQGWVCLSLIQHLA